MTADSTTTTTRRINTTAPATPALIQADVHWVDTLKEERKKKKEEEKEI